MAKALTQTISDQISAKDLGITFIFKINSTDYSSSLKSWDISANKSFGSASASFVLDNNDGAFGSGGANEIKPGDVVEFIETYTGDSTQFKRFYGKIEQKSITKHENDRVINLTCLDYISILQQLDIDLEIEGDKVEVTNETLSPSFLPSPNQVFAQIFNFANDALSDSPRPILVIRDLNNLNEDPQFDGFDVYYDSGQVKFGAPLNAVDNHEVIAKSYHFYTSGVFVEDIIETILKEPDGYDKYLFGETSQSVFVANHLQTTYQDEQGAGILDYLTPNLISSTIEIRHTLSGNISAGVTSITLEATDGLPTSGSATLAGDTFTWTGKTSTTLTGIPASGTNALKAHKNGSTLKYETSYAAGQVWYLTYSNIVTTLASANFTIPGGTFSYFDKRNGRIILASAISTSATVRCNYNYTFKTIQATGIELNRITFRSREVENRYEALQKVRKYLAPHYIIRTQGDNKIWASYLSQRTTADYNLTLISNLQYLEDEDLYTRVKMFGKNKAPTNLMFNEDVDLVTTGETYRANAVQTELNYVETVDGWHTYESLISDAGQIVLDRVKPLVYINGIPIDNAVRQMISQQVVVRNTTRTETSVESSTSGGTDVTVNVYYYYQVYFGHQNIEPTRTISLHNTNGVTIFTISPFDNNMDYGRGIYNAPGTAKNATLENVATGTYFVMYATRFLQIDYDNVRFKINGQILPSPTDAVVSGTFEYFTVFTSARGVGAIIDGRWDTQVQTEFYAQPPTGYNYAILDLGAEYNIQAIDIVAGFFKPDEFRRIDIDMRMTLHYSLDNVSYNEISDKTHNFQLSGGQSTSFEEDDLGIDFSARYLKLILENVKRIEFDKGVYPVALTEVAIYADIILKSEATLIPTTFLTSTATTGNTTVNVESTEGFSDPSSGQTATAYIDEQSFTYTGYTATQFVGCTLSGGISEVTGTRVHQTIAGDTSMYDDDGLLPQLGDRVFKDVRINDAILYTQDQLDSLAKSYLREFYKDHTKISVDILYSPYLQVGQTVSLTDTYNNQSATNYFIESIKDSSGFYTLVLAKYPA